MQEETQHNKWTMDNGKLIICNYIRYQLSILHFQLNTSLRDEVYGKIYVLMAQSGFQY